MPQLAMVPASNAMPPPAANLPLIDQAAMAATWEDAGPDLFRDIARLFEIERKRAIARLPQALAEHDRAQLVFEAHTLKGAAAYICASLLQDAARALEREAPFAPPERLAGLVAELIAAADATAPALASAMARMPDCA